MQLRTEQEGKKKSAERCLRGKKVQWGDEKKGRRAGWVSASFYKTNYRQSIMQFYVWW